MKAAETEPHGHDKDPPIDWSVFDDGLAAAVMVKIPIHLGSGGHHGGRLTLEKLELLRKLPASQLPARYRVAREIFSRCGNMQIVLDGLTHNDRSEQRLSRILWGSLIYLVVLAVLGYAGLAFYLMFVAPNVNALRGDMALVPETPDTARLDPIISVLPTVLTIAPIAFVLVCLGLWVTGGVSGWARRLGGSAFIRDQATSVAMRLIAWMTRSGVPMDDAVRLSCELIGSERSTRLQIENTMRGRHAKSVGEPALMRLANHFQTSASNRINVLRVVLPLLLTAAIGGTGVLAYSLAIFHPLISLIEDLSEPTRVLPTQHPPSRMFSPVVSERFDPLHKNVVKDVAKDSIAADRFVDPMSQPGQASSLEETRA
ncbi:hypothetical protein LOC71_16710 [Rhodopirellula sp. JC740]|uniref:Type II secretion system protein GspF domain-containing protein n=1 Tax=Rhodopirellula halodulae TaxID=2894198 RepID=A0ABS8NKM8_9BACT|nr:hypothetical protein [Rhodopirellula sp. JC740]MCC9643929.1 hypothetical protein [Rhodopirellula sp. JC740]